MFKVKNVKLKYFMLLKELMSAMAFFRNIKIYKKQVPPLTETTATYFYLKIIKIVKMSLSFFK